MNVELLNEVRVCLTDIINLVTGVTPCCVHSLNAEDCMCSALGRTTHIVQLVVYLPPRLHTTSLAVRFQIVWIYVFSVQKAKYFLKCLLGATHVSFHKILASN